MAEWNFLSAIIFLKKQTNILMAVNKDNLHVILKKNNSLIFLLLSNLTYQI